jgi:ribosomal protein S18 acetylase RimI-like enzyme
MSRSAERLVAGGEAGNATALAGAVLPLLHDASRPYVDWLFGGRLAALEWLAAALRRPSSEVAFERATLLLRGDGVDGFFVALAGSDLGRSRKADSLALLMQATGADRSRIHDRLAAARSLFAPVAADEWYLSKLAVAPGARGGGLGGRLCDAYLEAGAEHGFERFRLDVDAANDAALRLYERRGFRVAYEGATADGGLEYVGMTLEART